METSEVKFFKQTSKELGIVFGKDLCDSLYELVTSKNKDMNSYRLASLTRDIAYLSNLAKAYTTRRSEKRVKLLLEKMFGFFAIHNINRDDSELLSKCINLIEKIVVAYRKK